MSMVDRKSSVADLVAEGVREGLRELSVEETERLGQLDPVELVAAMLNLVPRADLSVDVGPFYDTAGLVRWLGKTRQALHQRIAKQQLLAVRTTSGQVVFPAWQFRPDGRVVGGLPGVLKVLLAEVDEWTAAVWLSTVTPALDDRSPIEVLRGSSRDGRVLELAVADAARWSR